MSLIIEDAGHVRLLRLDRPERENALTTALGWGIVRAVADAQADDDVRVVAITGNGDAFCSGLDLGGSGDAPVDSGLSDQQETLDEMGWVGGSSSPCGSVRQARDRRAQRGCGGCRPVARHGRGHPHRGRHRPPALRRRTKRVVARAPLVADVGARLVDEVRSTVAGLGSEDGREAVRAIMEKRAPEFQDK